MLISMSVKPENLLYQNRKYIKLVRVLEPLVYEKGEGRTGRTSHKLIDEKERNDKTERDNKKNRCCHDGGCDGSLSRRDDSCGDINRPGKQYCHEE